MTFFNDDLTFDLVGGEDLEDAAADDAGYEYGGTEARIFLVDAHRRMFNNVKRRSDDDDEDDGEGESLRSYFVDVINAVLLSIRRRVFSSNTALYAIVLYGTNESKNSYGFKGVYVLQDLNMVDPGRIGELEEMIEEGDRRFETDLGHSATEVSLADALHTASVLFRQCSTKLGEKRIFLFTSEDDPYEDDDNAKRKALQRAVDLKELQQEITLIPLQPSTENKASFDPSLFYKELLQLSDEEAEIIKKQTTSTWDELEARLKGLEDKRRRLAALDFHLGKVNGESVSFSVGLYSMVREKAGPKFVYRSSRDNNTEVKTVTRKFLGGDDGDGTLLIPSDIKKGIAYGGRNLIFEEDELTKIKDFGGSPGIQLLGFKPISRLRSHHHIGPSSFLYPDEASTEGSTRLFVSLLRRCRERQKMALARIIPRQHSAPILAALIPQEEERGEDGLQILPSGFWVKPLPFSDDFRDLSSVIPSQLDAESNDCIEETKEITDKIVKKLTFKFDPRNFENPHLRNLQGVIESMALNRTEAPSVEDSTEPPNDRIDKKVGGLCQDWKELAWPSSYDPLKAPSAKRPATSSVTAGKKQKTANDKHDVDGGSEGPSATDVRKAAEGGLLGKMTVPTLKSFCKDNSIVCKGGSKKVDLIGVINEYFGIE